MTRYIKHLATIGPCFLHVYPSILEILCRRMARLGLEGPANVLGVLGESEIVLPEHRPAAERCFRRRCFSCYGPSERVVLGAECEEATNGPVCRRMDPASFWILAVGASSRPGGRGEITGTGFIRGGVPCIRYHTGDEATYVGDRCAACKRCHMLLHDIRGASETEYVVADDASTSHSGAATPLDLQR